MTWSYPWFDGRDVSDDPREAAYFSLKGALDRRSPADLAKIALVKRHLAEVDPDYIMSLYRDDPRMTVDTLIHETLMTISEDARGTRRGEDVVIRGVRLATWEVDQ